MKSFKNVLDAFIDPQYFWKIKLHKEWKTIIGELNHSISIEAIRGSTLIIGVSHPAWGHELSFFTDMLLQKINAVLGEKKVLTIRFKVAYPSSQNKRQSIFKQKNAVKIQNSTFSQQHSLCLKKIRNKELQYALKNYLSHCLAKSEGAKH